MVEPSNSPPPPGPEKPKRKYTVSDKVLAANRAKLVQANADPEKKYRPTPKRLASTYANCLKAREGKRQKRKRGLATGVRYGLTVTDLYSTLGLADASREELDEHYRYFHDLIKPQNQEEDKFTRALAECSWRRSQVLHVHAVDSAMLMKARLMMASAMASDDSRENVPARSLAILMMDVFNRRRPDLEEQLGILTRHFERLSFLLLALRGEQEGFGKKIRWGRRLGGRGGQLIEELRDLKIAELLRLPAEALGNPFVSAAQVEEILREKSNDIKPLEQMKWDGKKKQEEERRQKLQKECQEATYAGYLDSYGDPEKVEGTGATESVQDDGRARAEVGEGETKREFVLVEGTALVAGLRTDEWSEEEERKLVAELRRQWIETSEQLRREGKETVGGVDLDGLGEALAVAFGIRGSGSADVGPGGARPGEESELEGEESPAAEDSANPEPQIPNRPSAHGDSANPEPQTPNPADASASSPTPDNRPPTPDPPDLREVTATAWDRVRFMEWWSRWEREEMKTILQRTGQTVRQTLEALLGLFRGYKKILFEATHYEAKLQDALFRFLSRLYGGDPGFERPSSVWTDPEQYRQMKEDMEGVW